MKNLVLLALLSILLFAIGCSKEGPTSVETAKVDTEYILSKVNEANNKLRSGSGRLAKSGAEGAGLFLNEIYMLGKDEKYDDIIVLSSSR